MIRKITLKRETIRNLTPGGSKLVGLPSPDLRTVQGGINVSEVLITFTLHKVLDSIIEGCHPTADKATCHTAECPKSIYLSCQPCNTGLSHCKQC